LTKSCQKAAESKAPVVNCLLDKKGIDELSAAGYRVKKEIHVPRWIHNITYPHTKGPVQARDLWWNKYYELTLGDHCIFHMWPSNMELKSSNQGKSNQLRDGKIVVDLTRNETVRDAAWYRVMRAEATLRDLALSQIVQ